MLVAPVACLLSCHSPVEGTWTLSPHSPALPGVLLGQTVQQPSPNQAQGIRRPSEGRSAPGVRVPDAHRPPALWSVLLSTIWRPPAPWPGPCSHLPALGRPCVCTWSWAPPPPRGFPAVGAVVCSGAWGVPFPPQVPLAAFCLLPGGASVPAAPGECPVVGPSPHGPGRLLWRPHRLQARPPRALERQGHTL